MSDYLWPHPKGTEVVNRLLSLPVTGREQDWEIELADSTRLDEFLNLFESGRLDLEGRSALALLILFSITYAAEPVGDQLMDRTRHGIRKDNEVLRRMRSYWRDGFMEHERLVQHLIA